MGLETNELIKALQNDIQEMTNKFEKVYFLSGVIMFGLISIIISLLFI